MFRFVKNWLYRRYIEDCGVKVRAYEKHLPWLRAIWDKSASQSALGVTERKATNMDLETVHTISEGMQVLEFRVRATSATSADGKTGTMYVYLARKGDDIVHACSVDMTVGTQIATWNDANYVDTMVVTQKWTTDVELTDNVGNNGMATFSIDCLGYDEVAVRINYSGDTHWYVDLSGYTK
jgi:hypothetical protein